MAADVLLSSEGIEVLHLDAEDVRRLRRDLAAILVDCVEGGASISFMWPFTQTESEAWWDGVIAAVEAGRTDLVAARIGDEWVGSAQLGLDQPPNQQHRADVKKVIVHRKGRGRGVGAMLMKAVETRARHLGRSLLVLDTVTDSPAHRLYGRLGWTEVGVIPDMALWPDGRFCDATVFWKRV